MLERGVYLINRDRLFELSQDLKEWEEECEVCFKELERVQHPTMKKIIEHSARAYFYDLHILCEDFISINLKDLKKFKIDISAVEGMEIIKEANRVSHDFFAFYVASRRLRNRLAHRYKRPTDEELYVNMRNHFELIQELEIALKKM